MDMITRRRFVSTSLATSACALAASRLHTAASDRIAPYRTPYKYPELVFKATGNKSDFNGISVDDPIVFRANGRFRMLHIGFDGTGYQSGLATSGNLIHWTPTALVGPRDPSSQYTKYSLAISSILRDKNLHGTGEALRIHGQYLAAWNAYPGSGYEAGWQPSSASRARTICCTGRSLIPSSLPRTARLWEHGGLYRPDLLLDRGTYYLYYNAKIDNLPKSEGGGWHEQTGVAISTDLKKWTRYAGVLSCRMGRAVQPPILRPTRCTINRHPHPTRATAASPPIPTL